MSELPELAEPQASGAVARIYAEIRAAYAAPYVSSLHRHLATYPGLLEWFWAALRPAFDARLAQHLAWSRAEVSGLRPLPRLSRPALRLLGVDERAETTLRNALGTFARVSPVNLVFGACVRAILEDEAPRAGGGAGGTAAPAPPLPDPLGPAPPLVAAEGLPADVRRVLGGFETALGGRPFMPGLYRMLAHWPAYLAHVATVLTPYLSDGATAAACARIADRIAGAHADVLAGLAPPPTPPPADTDQRARILAAVATYRVTSPQMVGFSTLLLRALPDQGTAA